MVHIVEQPESPQREDGGSPEIGVVLLRRGVRRMEALRPSCCGCGRSPLVGERISVFRDKRGRERSACELCAAEPGAASLGEQVSTTVVRAGERPLAVRRAA